MDDDLHDIMEFIDESKTSLNDSRYLELSNNMKTISERLLSSSSWENLKLAAQCIHEGVFCNCSVDRRVNILINNVIKIPRYLETIGEMAAEIHVGRN